MFFNNNDNKIDYINISTQKKGKKVLIVEVS